MQPIPQFGGLLSLALVTITLFRIYKSVLVQFQKAVLFESTQIHRI